MMQVVMTRGIVLYTSQYSHRVETIQTQPRTKIHNQYNNHAISFVPREHWQMNLMDKLSIF